MSGGTSSGRSSRDRPVIIGGKPQSGLLPDRLYCYRIRARNSFGSDVTPQDKQACGYTRDGNNLTLGRVQLRIRVADIANALPVPPEALRDIDLWTG